MNRRQFTSQLNPVQLFALIFTAIFLLHAPLLRLPYFWDEAGYYIPAARDLYLTGALIPHSTLTNAHPPLVMAYLALTWKLFGYSPPVTRIAMLLVAAFALTAVFELARRILDNAATTGVAIAATICTAAYPVFFAQASLAHLDMAAAALTLWGILFYVERRFALAALWFSLALLAKETAVIAPLALFAWSFFSVPSAFSRKPLSGQASSESAGDWRMLPLRVTIIARFSGKETGRAPSRENTALGMTRKREVLWLLAPIIPLALWYAFHFFKTGHIFGNPQFLAYNVGGTLTPARFVFAALRRLWQLTGYMNLFALTLAAALAMFFPAQLGSVGERKRIAIPVQLAFAAVIAAYWLAMSLIGGAVLARYLLPAIPLIIIVCASTVRRRVRGWPALIALIVAIFVLGLFVNPPYVFAPEDNLAYRDYVELHQQAADFLQSRYPHAGVLTAWPASDELRHPWLGYVREPFRVVQIEDFTPETLQATANTEMLPAPAYDVALVFSTKYEPPRRLSVPRFWQRAQERWFGYHRDAQPLEAAQILGGRVVWEERRTGQWAAVIEMPQVREARLNRGDAEARR